jgi:hypothetical protein
MSLKPTYPVTKPQITKKGRRKERKKEGRKKREKEMGEGGREGERGGRERERRKKEKERKERERKKERGQRPCIAYMGMCSELSCQKVYKKSYYLDKDSKQLDSFIPTFDSNAFAWNLKAPLTFTAFEIWNCG